MDWKHTISFEDATWIYENKVKMIDLWDEGKICLVSDECNYETYLENHIFLEPLVFFKKEVLLEPSNHSLARLSNEVAETLFWINKEKVDV